MNFWSNFPVHVTLRELIRTFKKVTQTLKRLNLLMKIMTCVSSKKNENFVYLLKCEYGYEENLKI